MFDYLNIQSINLNYCFKINLIVNQQLNIN